MKNIRPFLLPIICLFLVQKEAFAQKGLFIGGEAFITKYQILGNKAFNAFALLPHFGVQFKGETAIGLRLGFQKTSAPLRIRDENSYITEWSSIPKTYIVNPFVRRQIPVIEEAGFYAELGAAYFRRNHPRFESGGLLPTAAYFIHSLDANLGLGLYYNISNKWQINALLGKMGARFYSGLRNDEDLFHFNDLQEFYIKNIYDEVHFHINFFFGK